MQNFINNQIILYKDFESLKLIMLFFKFLIFLYLILTVFSNQEIKFTNQKVQVQNIIERDKIQDENFANPNIKVEVQGIKSKNQESKVINQIKDRSQEKNKYQVPEAQNNPSLIDNHIPMTKFMTHPSDIVINPYYNIRKYITEKKAFSSVCLKCAACLAIAQHINISIPDMYKNNDLERVEAKEHITFLLKRLCLRGFKNYDLRNYNGMRLVTRISTKTTHASSSMDGKWTMKLREMCSYYVDDLDISYFYDVLRFQIKSVDDFLCRGHGIYRDCINMDMKIIEIPGEDENALMSISFVCVM